MNAWAAGFLDGEGCIHIRSAIDRRYADGTRGTTGATYTTWALFVQISQSGEDVPASLMRLQNCYGGCIHGGRRPAGARKPVWIWVVSAAKAERFLNAVVPYLTEKREQAEIALEYRQNAIGRGNVARAARYSERLKAAKS
jgi:hypothetical protein